MNLRWIMRDGERVLQQLEIYHNGDIKRWVDVPCVPLEEEQVTG